MIVGLVLLAGCPSADDPMFTVAEPAAGATFDRCHVRARTSVPPGTVGGGIGEGSDDDLHVDWRLDGGVAHQVEPAFVLTDEEERLVFALAVPEGAHQLELGTCDTFDRCDWLTGPSLSVANAAGAPDCRARELGHQVFPDDEGGELLAILPDGKQLLYTGQGDARRITRLGTDGTVDTSFGSAGHVDSLPLIVDQVVLADDGGLLVTGPGALAHITPSGVFDTSFGTYQNVQGLRPSPCPDARSCMLRVLRADGAGGFWAAGGLGVDGQAGMFTPFVMHLDAMLAVTAHTELDATVTGDSYAFEGAAVDAAGHAVIVVNGTAVAGSLAGLDAGWRFALPAVNPLNVSSPSIVVEGTRVAIARMVTDWSDSTPRDLIELHVFDGGVARALSVPAGDDAETHVVRVQLDATGRAYVAATRTTPSPPFVFDAGPGSEVIVARVVDGALDATWGDAGVARFDSSDVAFPVAVDPNHERLTGFLLDADGAPWVSTETYSGTQGFSTQRRGNALVKLRVD